jgi:hypothetical protein
VYVVFTGGLHRRCKTTSPSSFVTSHVRWHAGHRYSRVLAGVHAVQWPRKTGKVVEWRTERSVALGVGPVRIIRRLA